MSKIEYTVGTYFGCRDKSAAAVWRASPNSVLRPMPSGEVMSTYTDMSPGWEHKVNMLSTCTGATLGPLLPANPAHKPGADVDATLAQLEGSAEKFTAVLQNPTSPAVIVPPGLCVLSASPGENFIADWANPTDPASGGWRATCTYLMSELVTAEQLTHLQQNIDSASFNRLMTTLASRPTAACPINPLTGTKQTLCSGLRALTEVGGFTRTWFASLPAPQRDTLMAAVCGNNPNLAECKCINRAGDNDYNTMKQIRGLSDSCWFLPCMNSTDFFVPSALENPTCPTNTCEIVSTYMSNNNIGTLGKATVLSCPPLAPAMTPATFPSQINPILLAIGGGIAVLIIIILMLVL